MLFNVNQELYNSQAYTETDLISMKADQGDGFSVYEQEMGINAPNRAQPNTGIGGKAGYLTFPTYNNRYCKTDVGVGATAIPACLNQSVDTKFENPALENSTYFGDIATEAVDNAHRGWVENKYKPENNWNKTGVVCSNCHGCYDACDGCFNICVDCTAGCTSGCTAGCVIGCTASCTAGCTATCAINVTCPSGYHSCSPSCTAGCVSGCTGCDGCTGQCASCTAGCNNGYTFCYEGCTAGGFGNCYFCVSDTGCNGNCVSGCFHSEVSCEGACTSTCFGCTGSCFDGTVTCQDNCVHCFNATFSNACASCDSCTSCDGNFDSSCEYCVTMVK